MWRRRTPRQAPFSDGGANWQAVAAAGAICPRCKQEMALAVSPLDPNIVFFGAVSLYRSTDGGQTFTKTMNSKTSGAVHSDIHALAFSEFVPGQLWVGSDGGVWSVDDSSASLPLDWQSVNGGLSISQFYGLAVHPTDPNLAYGGTQDNGVVLKYTGSQAWCALVAPGDGGSMAVDPAAPTTLYGYAAILLLERSLDGGVHWAPIRSGLDTSDRTQVYPPYEMDPRDSHVLYLGTYRLYRTSTRGDLWQVISPDLTIDPADPNSVGNLSAVGAGGPDTGVIYTGSTNGQIYVTSDLGASWTRRVSANLPRRFVSSIAVHPLDSSVA